MKKLLVLSMAITLLIFTTLTATATTITDGDHILGLYGFQKDNGVNAEIFFPDAIAGTLPEVILENQYLDGSLGRTGFILAANWNEEEKIGTSGVDFQGTTLNLFQDSPLNENYISIVDGWTLWWISYAFPSDDPNDISRMFAEINYGSYSISEEITREFSSPAPVPEPATMILFGLGLLGLAGVSRKK